MFSTLVPVETALDAIIAVLSDPSDPSVTCAEHLAAFQSVRANFSADALAQTLHHLWGDPRIHRMLGSHPDTLGATAVLRAYAGPAWLGIPTSMQGLRRITRSMAPAMTTAENAGPAPFAITCDQQFLYVADHLLHDVMPDLDWSMGGTWIGSDRDPDAGVLAVSGNRFADWIRIVHRALTDEASPSTHWMTSPRWIVALTARAWPVDRVRSIPGGADVLADVQRVSLFYQPAVHAERPPLWWCQPDALPVGAYRIASLKRRQSYQHRLSLAAFCDRAIDDPTALAALLMMAAPGDPPARQLAAVLELMVDALLPDPRETVIDHEGRRLCYVRPTIRGVARGWRYSNPDVLVLSDLALMHMLRQLQLIPDHAYVGSYVACFPPRQLLRGGFLDVLLQFAAPCRSIEHPDTLCWSWSTHGPLVAQGFEPIAIADVAALATSPGELEPDGGYAVDELIVRATPG